MDAVPTEGPIGQHLQIVYEPDGHQPQFRIGEHLPHREVPRSASTVNQDAASHAPTALIHMVEQPERKPRAADKRQREIELEKPGGQAPDAPEGELPRSTS